MTRADAVALLNFGKIRQSQGVFMASSPFTFAFAHQQTLPIHETLAQPADSGPQGALISPDGKKSFFFDERGAHLKNTETGEQIDFESSPYEGYNAITFSADSKIIYVLTVYSDAYDLGPDEQNIVSYDLDNLTEKGKVIFAASSNNVKIIASDSGASFIFVYSSSGKDFYEAFDTRTGGRIDLHASSSGVEGNGIISEVRLVDDGTFAVFVSTSSNLVPGDTNGVADVFMKNMLTGEVTRLSTSGAGVQANGASGGIDISADGKKVLFQSTATNLVASDANGFQDVFVKDLATGRVALVSTSATGLQGNGVSGDGVFSPDGRTVAFRSTAANLIVDDVNGTQDVFLKSLATGAVTSLSSIGPVSVPVTDKPAFSSDGGTVTFGQYSYDVDNAGLLILDLTRTVSFSELDSVTISKGDGSASDFYRFFANQTIRSVGIDYEMDGDFKATITGFKGTTTFEGLASGVPVANESFTVKVRAHAGSQTFTGDGGGEVVLLSSVADRADGAGGDDTLFGYGGADDLSGGAGNDVLDGGLGDDILRGGFGDDRYYVDSPGDTVIEADGAGRDTVFASVSTALAANVENLVLVGSGALTGTGNALGNVITGNGEKNVLYGLDGDDVLDGGAGDDRMVGGAGNDRYIVDSMSDVVEEAANGGIDTVVFNIKGLDKAGIGNNVENLILSDDPVESYYLTFQGSGNALDNIITGNRAGNKLLGGEGNDTLIGNDGNDNLDGGNGRDTLEGGAGGDYLDGGAGADRMIGGAGDDLYIVSESGDQVVEAVDGGNDAVSVSFDFALSPGSNVENIQITKYTTTEGFRLTGNELSNRVGGSGGNDVLDGGRGADMLVGGGGNDTYLIDDVGDVVVERSSEGADTVVTSVEYALKAGASVETLKFADNRAAGSLDLSGNEFAQTLIGNGGASRLFGYGGDDTYIVDDGNDLVFESGGQGNDTVVTTGSYTLGVGQEIETLRLAAAGGTAKRGLAGNAFANTLIGNAGINSLDGAAGADALYGLGGDDTYLVDDVGDRVFEQAGQGFDTVRASASYVLAAGQSIETLELVGSASLDLTGNDLANTLRDNAGNNRLDGGEGDDILVSSGGRDVLVGGAGSDSAVIDRSGVTVALSFVMASVNGTTTLVGDGTTTTSIGNITLTGGSGNDTFVTLDGIDVLNGGAGNDTLDGGSGADRLIGGLGDDTLIVDNARDQAVEAAGQGTDKVLSSISYTLAAGQEIEALQLLGSTGSAALNLTGNAFAQTLVGNNGANILDGGAGADVMNGRGGDDTYIIDNGGDRVVEAARGGNDKVLSLVSHKLTAGQEIEALQLLSSTGSANLHLEGNEFGQTLVGNNGANTLNGNLGNDVLIGRGGADTFIFANALGASNVDRIADFAPEDTLRLSKGIFTALAPGQLAANAFKDIGTTDIDADDRILYNSNTGELLYDADGWGAGRAIKFAVLDNKAAITAADFIIA